MTSSGTTIGSRSRAQPAPPHVVFDSLVRPDRPGERPWLFLFDDERDPKVIAAHRPDSVVWSSLWPSRPDARIRFDIEADGSGTVLRWTLIVDEPVPDDSKIGHLRKRLNELVNRDLRLSYGN